MRSIQRDELSKNFAHRAKRISTNHYYVNIISWDTNDITFDQICKIMKSYFESVEFKKAILVKFNAMILKKMITKNQEKFMKECLQMSELCLTVCFTNWKVSIHANAVSIERKLFLVSDLRTQNSEDLCSDWSKLTMSSADKSETRS
jgi:hypothetical protein